MVQILQGLIFGSKVDDEHKNDEDRHRDINDAEVVNPEELHAFVFLLHFLLILEADLLGGATCVGKIVHFLF